MHRRTFIAGVGAALASPALGQDADGAQGTLNLSASLGTGPALPGGLRWRVFKATADADGLHRLMVESAQAHPNLTVPPGDYVVSPLPPGARFAPRAEEQAVTVSAGKFAHVTMSFDNGMR